MTKQNKKRGSYKPFPKEDENNEQSIKDKAQGPSLNNMTNITGNMDSIRIAGITMQSLEGNKKTTQTSTSDVIISIPAKKKKKNQNKEIHVFAKKGLVPQCLHLLTDQNVDLHVKGNKEMTPLHFAAQNGHDQLVRELLNKKANRYMKDKDGLLPLHQAARRGKLECVKELIKGCTVDDLQISYKTMKGRTPLMESAVSGYQDCCLLLIGLVIDEVDNDWNSALHLATKGDHGNIAKILLSNNAAPAQVNKDGLTPLELAIKHNFINCLEIIQNATQPSNLGSFVEQAGEHNNIQGTNHFQSGDVETTQRNNIQEDEKEDVQHIQTQGDENELVLLSCSSKEPRRFYDMQRDTLIQEDGKEAAPLRSVSKKLRRGHDKSKLLSRVFVCSNNQDEERVAQNNIQHITDEAEQGDEKEPDQISNSSQEPPRLYAKQDNSIQKDKKSTTQLNNWSQEFPLIYAIKYRKYDYIYSLLDEGVALDVIYKGTYPFLVAAERGLHLVCKKIIEKDPSVLTQVNDKNQTALHLAAMKRNVKIVDLLCGKIKSSAVDKNRQTALHLAINQKDNERVTRLLIRAGTPVAKKNSQGFTAFHLAANMGQKRCCELILEKNRSILYIPSKGEELLPLDTVFAKLYLALNGTEDGNAVLEENKIMDKYVETIVYLLKEYSEDYMKRKAELDKNTIMIKCKGRMGEYMAKAIDMNLRKIADALLDSVYWEDAIVGQKCHQEPNNFKKLLQVFPNLALKVQGKCIKSSTSEETEFSFKPYEDTYYMEDGISAFDQESGELKEDAVDHNQDVYRWDADHCVNLMISRNECELFKHPLTLAWLRKKWKSYTRYIHYLVLALETIYLCSLVCLMATTWNWVHISHAFNITKGEFCEAADQLDQSPEATQDAPLMDSSSTSIVKEFESRVNGYRGFYIWSFLMWVIKVVIEIFYVVRLKSVYFYDQILSRVYSKFEMLSPHLIRISQLILTMILIFVPFGMCYTGRIGLLQEDLSWGCGIFSVLFAWLHLVNSLNHAMTSVFLPITQEFLEMFIKVIYFLVTFVLIFAFVFHLLLMDQKSFESVPQSIGSTLVWMLTDLGYKDFFVESQPSFPILSNVIFFLFITTIACVILSVINRERTVKSRGKDLNLDYRRLVIYARLIFKYDICFPQFRRRFAVNKCKMNCHNEMMIEYYLGEIENAKEQADSSRDNKAFMERINKLETMITKVNDHIETNQLELSRLKLRSRVYRSEHKPIQLSQTGRIPDI